MNYTFELFCIEPDDIKNEQSFLKALSYSDSLWKGKEPSGVKNSPNTLEQKDLGIKVKILPLDTEKMVTDYIETAFILNVSSKNFEEIEEFRIRLLKHLKAKLTFSHIRILKDDISTDIANQLYPKINEIENLLRRYLTKFFLQRIGLKWWDVSANSKMLDKVKLRKKDRKDEFSNYISSDIEYADFDDLGTLIYKQSSGFNQPEKALEELLLIDDLEKLEDFKNELKGNYVKYFKEYFREKNFEKLWIELFKIRNKVAHQGTFYLNELTRGNELYSELKSIVEIAESKIDEVVLSLEDKVALRNRSIDILTQENEFETEEERNTNILDSPKIVGKIELPEKRNYTHRGHSVLSEQELFDKLEKAEQMSSNQFVGLKWFVTQFLAEYNYSIGFSYSLINILSEKGEIVLYDVPAYGGYDIKAIKKM
jgi:hypothetical protein